MNTLRTTTIAVPAPSRRSVVRSAAWSVPVISVAATAPAFAASAAGSTTLRWNTPVKWSEQSTKHVSWDLALDNGAVEIDSVSIVFTYVPTGGGTFNAATFEIREFGKIPDVSWTKTPTSGVTPTITASRSANIAANSTYRLHVDFAGNDNSAGHVSASVTVTYVGGSTKSFGSGNIAWASGVAHTGH